MRSVCQQKGKGNLRHNNRIFTSNNVNVDRTKDNIVLKQQTLQDAYNECFGQATAEYNAKQKRKGRRITDYYQSLFGVSADSAEANSVLQSKEKTKSFYEDIVQIGDMHDTGCVSNPQAAEKAKQALIEYANGFAERNPRFHVFNAVIHMDEATPHLHIDYIPVASGYSRGLTVQNGYNRALEQMGFTGDYGFKRWREKERDVFCEICKSYGLDPKPKELEESRDYTYTPDEYRRLMRKAEKTLQKANEKASEINKKQSELNERIRTYNAKSKALKERTEAVEDKEKQVQQKALENERFLQQLQKMAEQINKQIVIKNRMALLEDIAGYDKDIEATTPEA